jgi:hypothetical protein
MDYERLTATSEAFIYVCDEPPDGETAWLAHDTFETVSSGSSLAGGSSSTDETPRPARRASLLR